MIEAHALNTIIKKRLMPDNTTKIQERTGERSAGKSDKKVPNRVTQRVTEKVTENQLPILDAIAEKISITAKQFLELMDISERKIKENIKVLKEKGLLKRIGPDKGGYWETIKS